MFRFTTEPRKLSWVYGRNLKGCEHSILALFGFGMNVDVCSFVDSHFCQLRMDGWMDRCRKRTVERLTTTRRGCCISLYL